MVVIYYSKNTVRPKALKAQFWPHSVHRCTNTVYSELNTLPKKDSDQELVFKVFTGSSDCHKNWVAVGIHRN